MEKNERDYYFNIFLNLVRATYMNLEKDWEKIAKEAGLTHAQMHALWILNLDDGLTLDELGNIALWNKSTTSALISRLVKKGYVRKEKYLNNSRIIKIYITDTGRVILDKSVGSKSAFEFMGLFENFDRQEIEVFLKTLDKICDKVGKWDMKDFRSFLEVSSNKLFKN